MPQDEVDPGQEQANDHTDASDTEGKVDAGQFPSFLPGCSATIVGEGQGHGQIGSFSDGDGRDRRWRRTLTDPSPDKRNSSGSAEG